MRTSANWPGTTRVSWVRALADCGSTAVRPSQTELGQLAGGDGDVALELERRRAVEASATHVQRSGGYEPRGGLTATHAAAQQRRAAMEDLDLGLLLLAVVVHAQATAGPHGDLHG